jgi:hypothetical protein
MLTPNGNKGMNQLSDSNPVYWLSTHVAPESFDNGALLLRLSDHHIFELNITAQCNLELSDGYRSLPLSAIKVALVSRIYLLYTH